jgi:hypothetical protein
MLQDLNEIIDSFGGKETAYDKEDKTRHLVQDLLIKARKHFIPQS